jgi:hypothetical protein
MSTLAVQAAGAAPIAITSATAPSIRARRPFLRELPIAGVSALDDRIGHAHGEKRMIGIIDDRLHRENRRRDARSDPQNI